MSPENPAPSALVVMPGGDLSPLSPVSQIDYWTSLDGKSSESKSLIYAARQGKAEQLADAVGHEIVVVDLLLHPVVLRREDGEEVPLTRAVAILDDGRTVGTCSTGVVSCLKTACQIWGLPPWRPGLRFRVVQLSISGNRRTFKLEPVVLKASPNGSKQK